MSDQIDAKLVADAINNLADTNKQLCASMSETAKSHSDQAKSRVHERVSMKQMVAFWGKRVDALTRSHTQNITKLCSVVIKQTASLMKQNADSLEELKEINKRMNDQDIKIAKLMDRWSILCGAAIFAVPLTALIVSFFK